MTHAGIDGHSRVITYLKASTDNTALTVLDGFVRATCQYGLPSRVRSDFGGENTLVALLMILLNGDGRGSHLTGPSIHNQRIERLWRDVFIQVIHHYYYIFYSFEEQQILDPDDDVHRYSLQMVYLPEIQGRLDAFRSAWNNHKLRTERNRTPNQMWMEGMVTNRQLDRTAINNVFGQDPYNENLETILGRYGVHLPHLQADQDDLDRAVAVRQNQITLTQEQQQTLAGVIAGVEDLKEKFVTCCTEISNLLEV